MASVSFPHPTSILDDLTLLREKIIAKVMSVVEEIQYTVCLNSLAPDIARYAEQLGNKLRSDTSSGLATVRACFDWLPELEAALALCDVDVNLDYVVVRNQMKNLVNACRDLLVVRAQFLCPVGDRALFKAVIEAAYGDLSSKLYSKVMNAYTKALSHLPDTFPSNSSMRGKRPKRVKDKQR